MLLTKQEHGSLRIYFYTHLLLVTNKASLSPSLVRVQMYVFTQRINISADRVQFDLNISWFSRPVLLNLCETAVR